MCKNPNSLTSSVLLSVICLACITAAGAKLPDPVSMWRFEEGSGGMTADTGIGGHPGMLVGEVAFVDDVERGSVLEFGAGESYVETNAWITEMGIADFSIAAWIRTDGQGAAIVGKSNGDRSWSFHEKQFYLSTGSEQGAPVAGGVHFYGNQAGEIWGSTPVDEGLWHHVCATWDNDTDEQHIYVDGVLDDLGPVWVYYGGRGDLDDDTVRIGFDCSDNSTSDFIGRMDDVAIFDVTLTAEQVVELMVLSLPVGASNPGPEDETTDLPRQEAVLSWNPGVHANRHDVYFGIGFDDVNDADRTNPLNVLISENHSQSRYPTNDTLDLDFGTTYFWRIDEVNAAPDFTVFKGDVWSFTTEPFSIPIAGIAATASSSFGASVPENTIDGSGLVDDLHGTLPGDMWISAGIPATIEYAFDRAYKLDELWIWNSNQDIEPFLGFGAKDIVIEHSLDGENWTVLEGVGPLARAPGTAGYAHNTTIDFGGATAQHVRVTVNSVQGFAPQASLSEVRFYAIPTHAREPNPAADATDVAPDTTLSWGRNGREADLHEVYVGTNADDLALAGATSDSTFSTDALNLRLGQTYAWRVDEVNEAMDPSTWEGTVWRFTTVDAISVDDMESYRDAEFFEIWATWVDGFNDPANGSLVGNGAAGTPETGIVHGGSQSLPLHFDNRGAQASEATRTFDQTQNWTQSGIQSLVLYLNRGADNTGGGQVYVKINDTKVLYPGDAAALPPDVWTQWTVDLSAVANAVSVRSLTIGVEGAGAMGVLYVDSIQLR